MKNNQYIRISVIAIIFMLLSAYTFTTISQAHENNQQTVQNGNLLANGSMDEGMFYWRPTNHFVAQQWYEWWVDWEIPEFIDGGTIYHNDCYPKPPDGLCYNDNTQTYNRSQGYIRYGVPYIAGIYQPVHNVLPCTLYTFEMWNRNDNEKYHAKIGIDPTGWVITQLSGTPPDNCPPDGVSPCPDPFIWGEDSIPNTIIWSEEYSQPSCTYGTCYWDNGFVTAEAVSTTITVWTYAAPEGGIALTTYWDYGSLVQTPFPDDKLPEPETWTSTGVISSVSISYLGSDVIISWITVFPASSQVWYYVTPGIPEPGPTDDLTNTVLLPYVHTSIQPITDPTMYSNITPIQSAPTTTHQTVISGLKDGDILTFVPLSRYPQTDSCMTATNEPYKITVNFP